MSIDFWRRGRVLNILTALSMVIAVAIDVATGRGVDFTAIVYLVLIALTSLGAPVHVFISSIGFAALYTLGRGLLGILTASTTTLLGFLTLYINSISNTLGIALLTLALFTPIYIVNPNALIPLSLIAIAILITIAGEYLRLGRAEVEVIQTRRTVYLSEELDYLINIKTSGRFNYTILRDDNVVAKGVAVDRISIRIPVVGELLGVHNTYIKVLLEDVRGLARVVHGPYTTSYTVIARTSTFLRKTEAILMRFLSYITTPRILRVSIGIPKPGAGSIGGVEGLGYPGYGRGEEISRDVESYEDKGLERRRDMVTLTIASKLLRRVEIYLSKLYAKAQSGEYIGVREYQPGDNPRTIHWKKSFRKELVEDMYVKIFASGEREGVGGRGGPRAVYADLTAINPRELDTIVSTIYGILLRDLENRNVFTEVHLFIKIPGEDIHYISGKVVDVLAALNTLILSKEVKALYNYETWRRSRTIKLGEAKGFVAKLEDYYRSIGLALADVLMKQLNRRTAITFIHSNALSYKYSIVAQTLRETGFEVLPKAMSIT